ncbi:hypothetical protein [Roseateles sp. MS654]|uniref:hypothetical protein n=1 Tax=Roseateles sp. MS654 TaxID=3412685 RepID=UPI003C2B3926
MSLSFFSALFSSSKPTQSSAATGPGKPLPAQTSTQEHFIGDLLTQQSARDLKKLKRSDVKPVDFKELDELYKKWEKACAKASGDENALREKLDAKLGAYIDWAKRQRHCKKIEENLLRAAKMQTRTAPVAEATSQRPRPLSTRSASSTPSSSASATSSSSSSPTPSRRSSITSIRSLAASLRRRSSTQSSDASSAPNRKPVNFAELKTLYENWRRPGSNGANDTALRDELQTKLERYLAWADGRSDLRDRRRVAAGMLAKILLAGAESAPHARPVSASAAPAGRTETASSSPAGTPSPGLPPNEADARLARVKALREENPDVYKPIGHSESRVLGRDGKTLYRLLPLRESPSTSIQSQLLGYRRVAMAGALIEGIRKRVGLDFFLPKVTVSFPDSRDEIPLVIGDAVEGKKPTSETKRSKSERDVYFAFELQNALLGQWILGWPIPKWKHFVLNADDRLRALDVVPHHGPLSEVWVKATGSVSPLFTTPADADGNRFENHMTLKPLEAMLRNALAHLDMEALKTELAEHQKRLDRHICPDRNAQSAEAEIRQMLAPLRALKEEVAEPPQDRPLEFVLEAAGRRLRDIDLKELR